MAGETAKTTAICLAIHPWSNTSHIVSWLTPFGRMTTSVKGAVRPKSAFLGQYDLNYECDIVYYTRAHGDIHALKECTPVELRESLRTDWRRLLLADHFRMIAGTLSPCGPEAADWFGMLSQYIKRIDGEQNLLRLLLAFEIDALKLSGLSPVQEAASGYFTLRAERKLKLEPAVIQCIANPLSEKKYQILLEASRVIGVFYSFHLDDVPKTRRYILQAIQQNEKEDKVTNG